MKFQSKLGFHVSLFIFFLQIEPPRVRLYICIYRASSFVRWSLPLSPNSSLYLFTSRTRFTKSSSKPKYFNTQFFIALLLLFYTTHSEVKTNRGPTQFINLTSNISRASLFSVLSSQPRNVYELTLSITAHNPHLWCDVM